MTNISTRTWLIIGFALSLLSVVTNIVILAGINDRIKEIDTELSKLNESLRTQAADIDRAEFKYDLFTVLNHISKLAKDEEKELAGGDSILFLQDFLNIYYAAVNGITATEMLKVETEHLAAIIPVIEKIREAERQKQAGNSDEAAKLMGEAERMITGYQPKSELGRKLQEVVEITELEGIKEMNTEEIASELFPKLKSLVDQYIANYEKKEEKIKELQNRRANLVWWGNFSTYAAVSLQLFGLMFVLTKDLAGDLKKRREEDEIAIKKAEEEIKEAQTEAGEAREDAEAARKQAGEAETMLAQLNEELKHAIDETDKVRKKKKS
jgi:hypothetical protein